MSDIMRGQSTGTATATEQALKAKFASTRVQEFQNEFARFASDAQSIKAEIISKHFDIESIAKESNVQFMFPNDQQMAQQAISLIKSDFYQYRIEVKPESVAMADMTAMKAERSEFLMAVSQYLQSIGPIGASAPWAVQYLLQMLQWSFAGFRGGSSIEGVMDQMVIAAKQAQQQAAMQPPPPDPKIELAKLQAQITAAEGQQGLQLDAQKGQVDIQLAQQKAQIELQKAAMDLQMKKAQMEFDFESQARQEAQDARTAVREDAQAEVEHFRGMQQSDEQHKQAIQQMREKAKATPKKEPSK
jgi:hypothetical protein